MQIHTICLDIIQNKAEYGNCWWECGKIILKFGESGVQEEQREWEGMCGWDKADFKCPGRSWEVVAKMQSSCD